MSDVLVMHVTFSSQELALRLNQAWRFVTVRGGKVLIEDEPVATIDKRGARVTLSPLGPREPVLWVAWALQSICPGSEAMDGETRVVDEPMTPDEAEKAGRAIRLARYDAIAKEAVPEGGGHEAVALVTYLVKQGHLELAGSTASVVRAIFPLLREVDENVGAKLEDALLDLDEVDELFAEAEQLTKIVMSSEHIFGQ